MRALFQWVLAVSRAVSPLEPLDRMMWCFMFGWRHWPLHWTWPWDSISVCSTCCRLPALCLTFKGWSVKQIFWSTRLIQTVFKAVRRPQGSVRYIWCDSLNLFIFFFFRLLWCFSLCLTKALIHGRSISQHTFPTPVCFLILGKHPKGKMTTTCQLPQLVCKQKLKLPMCSAAQHGAFFVLK